MLVSWLVRVFSVEEPSVRSIVPPQPFCRWQFFRAYRASVRIGFSVVRPLVEGDVHVPGAEREHNEQAHKINEGEKLQPEHERVDQKGHGKRQNDLQQPSKLSRRRPAL